MLIDPASSRGRRTSARYWLTTPILLLAVAVDAQAADRFWNSFFTGDFGTFANWHDGVLPGTADVARFGVTTAPLIMQADYTVRFDVLPTTKAFKIDDVNFVAPEMVVATRAFLIRVDAVSGPRT